MAHAGVTVPSPLAGEGGSVLPHAMMGEGVVEEPLHPFEIVDTPLRPLPQGERARKAFGDTRSRSRERNRAQSQSCGFSLFSSCSVLFSTAKSGDPRDAGRADFSFASRRLRDTRSAGLWPTACFFSVIYRKIQGRGGSPSHVADAAVHHYLTRVGGGADEGLIRHGVVTTFQKPHARGRARASRLRAAGGARPVQGRGADVVEHARALHRGRRARRHGGGLCARRLPPSD